MEYLNINDVKALFVMLDDIEYSMPEEVLKAFPQISEVKAKCEQIMIEDNKKGDYYDEI